MARRDAPRAEHTPLSIENVHAILTYAAEHCSHMDYTRWLLLFVTGARQGEALSLTWGQVDLVAGTLVFTGRRTAEPVSAKSKSESGDRRVQIIEPLRVALTALHDAETQPSAGQDPYSPFEIAADENPHGLVFHRGGSPIAAASDSHAWRLLLRDAGVAGPQKSLPVHIARHTAIITQQSGGGLNGLDALSTLVPAPR